MKIYADDSCYVCHKCDIPPCYRPSHLFKGDELSNIRDMLAKGRHRTNTDTLNQPSLNPALEGANNHQAKLTPEQVVQIRTLWASGFTQVALAARFGVAQGIISGIVLRRSWRNVP